MLLSKTKFPLLKAPKNLEFPRKKAPKKSNGGWMERDGLWGYKTSSYYLPVYICQGGAKRQSMVTPCQNPTVVSPCQNLMQCQKPRRFFIVATKSPPPQSSNSFLSIVLSWGGDSTGRRLRPLVANPNQRDRGVLSASFPPARYTIAAWEVVSVQR